MQWSVGSWSLSWPPVIRNTAAFKGPMNSHSLTVWLCTVSLYICHLAWPQHKAGYWLNKVKYSACRNLVYLLLGASKKNWISFKDLKLDKCQFEWNWWILLVFECNMHQMSVKVGHETIRFAIRTLEAWQTDRPERPRCFFQSAIYQHQKWLTWSLRGISVCLAKQSVAKWSPLWDGPLAFSTWRVLSVWVCLRVCWNLHLTQLCIHMWSVFLSQAPDALFPCLTHCANKTAILQQRQCLSLLFIQVHRL